MLVYLAQSLLLNQTSLVITSLDQKLHFHGRFTILYPVCLHMHMPLCLCCALIHIYMYACINHIYVCMQMLVCVVRMYLCIQKCLPVACVELQTDRNVDVYINIYACESAIIFSKSQDCLSSQMLYCSVLLYYQQDIQEI